TRIPRPAATFTAARIQAFIPGESPPEVRMAIVFIVPPPMALSVIDHGPRRQGAFSVQPRSLGDPECRQKGQTRSRGAAARSPRPEHDRETRSGGDGLATPVEGDELSGVRAVLGSGRAA